MRQLAVCTASTQAGSLTASSECQAAIKQQQATRRGGTPGVLEANWGDGGERMRHRGPRPTGGGGGRGGVGWGPGALRAKAHHLVFVPHKHHKLHSHNKTQISITVTEAATMFLSCAHTLRPQPATKPRGFVLKNIDLQWAARAIQRGEGGAGLLGVCSRDGNCLASSFLPQNPSPPKIRLCPEVRVELEERRNVSGDG